MRFGHSSTGIVGQSMKPKTIKTWAYSINSCCELAEGLEAMRNKDQQENTTHKEEMKGRINKHETDRSILRKKLEISIDIFDPSQHSKEGLVNIVTGKVITDPGVNVNDSSQIGKNKMKDFESSLPNGFTNQLNKP